MINKMRLISLKRLIKSMMVIIVLGFILSIGFLENAITLLLGPKDILTLSENEMNNAYVS